ncbi:MAG TPA: KpsF/GutQ family sugar-phosphate isomerase [Methylococcaceae bacterium]|nr:KpsF/GutQ family sugar-phosphate isomerase [Methylococcaceae bacterium]HIL40227.1 KpsF/GutQ family sugar-phosphate isomerase [Methylococcales bacterium]
MDEQALKKSALAVINSEIQAVQLLRDRIDEDFIRACKLMNQCEGRVIVLGMGKSGHIGGKIAATLASTGTPAFFVHAGEASHGDLGMVTGHDVVLALSNSGETAEIITLLPLIKRLGVPLIAMTGCRYSMLAECASVVLNVQVEREACPLGLAPTSSTTIALVMGDALAVALFNARGFTAEDFAFSHPGGNLGKRLLLRVSDIMHKNEAIPIVSMTALMSEVLLEITEKKLGMTVVVDDNKQVVGIFTDGDLRRMLGKNYNIQQICIAKVMSESCTTISQSILAVEAMRIMEEKKINGLIVTDEQRHVIGALNMHDLIQSGII